MRKSVVALLFAGMAVVRCDCGDDIRAARGVVIVEPLEIDFGIVCIGDTAAGEVTIKNDGLGDLRITKASLAQVSGGYTLGEVPGAITPGGLAKIPVTLTVAEVGADYNASIVFETDDPENPKRTVNLVAQAFGGNRRHVDLQCKRTPTMAEGKCNILDYGNVPNGQTEERMARVRNLGCGPLTIYEVKVEADTDGGGGPNDVNLFTVLGPTTLPLEIPGQGEVEMRIKFSPPAGATDWTPIVRAHVRSDDSDVDRSDWAVSLFAFGVAPSIQVDPMVLTFFGADTLTDKDVTISNAAGLPATVDLSFSSDASPEWEIVGSGRTGTLNLGAASQQTIRLGLTVAGGWGGTAQGKLVVTAAGQPDQFVDLYGGSFPSVTVTPIPVDCWTPSAGGGCVQATTVGAGRGCVGCDGAYTAQVTIGNSGDASLTVSAIGEQGDNAGDSFQVTPGALPVTLANGDAHTATVTFKDNPMITNDLAALTIQTNDPTYENGLVSVTLLTANDANFPPTPQVAVSPNQPSSWVVGNTLTFSGAATTDNEGDAITYAWALTGKPAGSTAAVSSVSGVTTTLTPDMRGAFRVSLTATDKYDPRPGQTPKPFTLTVNVQ